MNKIWIWADLAELSSAFVDKICIHSYVTELNLAFVNKICNCSYALNWISLSLLSSLSSLMLHMLILLFAYIIYIYRDLFKDRIIVWSVATMNVIIVLKSIINSTWILFTLDHSSLQNIHWLESKQLRKWLDWFYFQRWFANHFLSLTWRIWRQHCQKFWAIAIIKTSSNMI